MPQYRARARAVNRESPESMIRPVSMDVVQAARIIDTFMYGNRQPIPQLSSLTAADLSNSPFNDTRILRQTAETPMEVHDCTACAAVATCALLNFATSEKPNPIKDRMNAIRELTQANADFIRQFDATEREAMIKDHIQASRNVSIQEPLAIAENQAIHSPAIQESVNPTLVAEVPIPISTYSRPKQVIMSEPYKKQVKNNNTVQPVSKQSISPPEPIEEKHIPQREAPVHSPPLYKRVPVFESILVLPSVQKDKLNFPLSSNNIIITQAEKLPPPGIILQKNSSLSESHISNIFPISSPKIQRNDTYSGVTERINRIARKPDKLIKKNTNKWTEKETETSIDLIINKIKKKKVRSNAIKGTIIFQSQPDKAQTIIHIAHNRKTAEKWNKKVLSRVQYKEKRNSIPLMQEKARHDTKENRGIRIKKSTTEPSLSSEKTIKKIKKNEYIQMDQQKKEVKVYIKREAKLEPVAHVRESVQDVVKYMRMLISPNKNIGFIAFKKEVEKKRSNKKEKICESNSRKEKKEKQKYMIYKMEVQVLRKIELSLKELYAVLQEKSIISFINQEIKKQTEEDITDSRATEELSPNQNKKHPPLNTKLIIWYLIHLLRFADTVLFT